MKTITDHLAGYAAYHRDQRNIITHLVGIPLIVLGIETLLARPTFMVTDIALSPAILVSLAAALFYLYLDVALGLLMTVLLALAVWFGANISELGTAAWLTAGIGMFVVGWIFQFIGHYFEGKKPAFVDDIMGLAIGPLFVVAEIVFMLGGKKQLHQDIEARFQQE